MHESTEHPDANATTPSQPIVPLLKWPGGKRRLAPVILDLIPSQFGRYIEPFVGGAAVFFALQPNAAILADTDSGLIGCYSQVRDRPTSVIRALQRMKNSEADYYRVRESRPRTPLGAAAKLIYLTNLSFNGIYRLNFRGEFNVPYGYRTHLRPSTPERIRRASMVLRCATVLRSDFEPVVNMAQAGDVLYLDPPYTVAHSHNGFIRYNARLFSWSDQERLARCARAASKRGVSVIVSNADHPSIRSLYRDFMVRVIERASTIAAESGNRRPITECIFYRTKK